MQAKVTRSTFFISDNLSHCSKGRFVDEDGCRSSHTCQAEEKAVDQSTCSTLSRRSGETSKASKVIRARNLSAQPRLHLLRTCCVSCWGRVAHERCLKSFVKWATLFHETKELAWIVWRGKVSLRNCRSCLGTDRNILIGRILPTTWITLCSFSSTVRWSVGWSNFSIDGEFCIHVST